MARAGDIRRGDFEEESTEKEVEKDTEISDGAFDLLDEDEDELDIAKDSDDDNAWE